MRSLAAVVPPEHAERVRAALHLLGRLRTDLKVAHPGGMVAFPVTEGSEPLPDGAELREEEFRPTPGARPSTYRELLPWSEAEAQRLPRAFDVVGDVVLVRLPDGVAGRAAEVGEALLRFVPSARVVAWDRGVQGTERVRSLERIAGTGPFRTRHRENGLELDVDPGKAYFSPRLAREHARVAAAVRPGERFADLCCGIGPFALHAARDGRAGTITAVDSNPNAIALLRENLERLGLTARVRVVEGDLEAFLPSAGVSDRIVLNLPHEGIKYGPSVSAKVARGGTLHLYGITRRAEGPARGAEIRETLVPARGWTFTEHHVVHPYAPESDLMAFTFVRSE